MLSIEDEGDGRVRSVVTAGTVNVIEDGGGGILMVGVTAQVGIVGVVIRECF